MPHIKQEDGSMVKEPRVIEVEPLRHIVVEESLFNTMLTFVGRLWELEAYDHEKAESALNSLEWDRG